MDSVKQRLLKFIEYLGIKKNAFEQTIGMSNGFVNNTNDRMTKRSLDAIQAAYPQLNTDWLISGRGDMLRPEVPASTTPNSEVMALLQRIDRLIEMHEKDIEIHELNARNMDRLLTLLTEKSGLSLSEEKAVG